jgi:hypothetical protein
VGGGGEGESHIFLACKQFFRPSDDIPRTIQYNIMYRLLYTKIRFV